MISPISAVVCSVESGPSPIVSALIFPPAQPGRRSRSSGRAVTTTRRGTCRDPVDEPFYLVEQRVVGPVQVFDHEHGR